MNPKQQLQKLITDLQTKKFRDTEVKGLLSSIQEEQTKALQPVLERMAESIGQMAKEAMEQAVKDIKVEIPPIEIPPVDVRIPDIPAPQVTVNPPQVRVNAPEVKIPATKFPEFPRFPERMSVSMDTVTNKAPLPVILMDTQGRPFQFTIPGGVGGKADYFTIKGFSQSAFSEVTNPDGRVKVELPTGSSGLTDTELRASSIPVAQASGAVWSTNVVDAFGSTTVGSVFNADNRLRVSVETGGSGLTDSELRATAVPVSQVSGAVWSTAVAQVVNIESVLNSSTTTLGSGATFTGLAEDVMNYASISVSVFADQASGTDGLSIQQSSNGTNWDITDTYTIAASTGKTFSFQPVSRYFRVVYTNGGSVQGSFRLSTILHYFATKSSSQRSADAYTNETDLEQHWSFLSAFNGTSWDRLRNSSGEGNALRIQMANDAIASVNVRDVFSTTTTSTVVNPDNRVRVELPATTITGITNTTASAIIDSTGVQYSGSNPIPVAIITDATASTIAVGDLTSDAADTGSAPLKIGGIARTANPTAVAAGDRVSATYDDLGRQVITSHQVRDLVKTAYVSITNGTETTLLAATAGAFQDLIFLKGSNNSDAAVSFDIRMVTGGNVVDTIRIPANSTAGYMLPVKYPQSDTGNNWTVDGPDETGRTTTFMALFSQEI